MENVVVGSIIAAAPTLTCEAVRWFIDYREEQKREQRRVQVLWIKAREKAYF